MHQQSERLSGFGRHLPPLGRLVQVFLHKVVAKLIHCSHLDRILPHPGLGTLQASLEFLLALVLLLPYFRQLVGNVPVLNGRLDNVAGLGIRKQFGAHGLVGHGGFDAATAVNVRLNGAALVDAAILGGDCGNRK